MTVAAVTLVLSGCGKGPGMDDMDMALPHIGTWYFADPMPDDDILVPPGARLVLEEAKFTLAMGDDDMTTFELFQTPGFTKFEVEGTYTAAADGTFSFSLPDEDMDGVPDLTAFAPTGADLVAAAAIQTLIMPAPDGDVMITVDEDADPDTITVTGSFLDTLLDAFGMQVPEGGLVGCKGAPCMMAP